MRVTEARISQLVVGLAFTPILDFRLHNGMLQNVQSVTTKNQSNPVVNGSQCSKERVRSSHKAVSVTSQGVTFRALCFANSFTYVSECMGQVVQ